MRGPFAVRARSRRIGTHDRDGRPDSDSTMPTRSDAPMKGDQGHGHASIRPGGGRRKPGLRARRRLRPEVLDLEDRRLPSTFTVTDPSDSLTNGLPAVNTLRWAV